MSIDDFDANVFKLGTICRENHTWGDSGKTLRYRVQGSCVECRKIYIRGYYEKNKEHIIGEINTTFYPHTSMEVHARFI